MLHRRLAQFRADFLVEFDAGRDLDDLLMPTLHRAIAFVQVNHVAVLVAENLDLDVFRARNVAFEEHRRIAERATRLTLRFIEQVRQIAGLVHHAHPATTAAERRFDDERETNLLRRLQRLGAIRRSGLPCPATSAPQPFAPARGRRFCRPSCAAIPRAGRRT
jgi:hypothetical protein